MCLENLTCDRCGERFEPYGVMVPTGPCVDEWKWRRPSFSEIEGELDDEGWWSDSDDLLCPDCCEVLEEKGVYPEDWEDEDEIAEELNGTNTT